MRRRGRGWEGGGKTHLDVAREKEDVVGGQLELRADRRDGVAAALHGGQEEAVQRAQPGCLRAGREP